MAIGSDNVFPKLILSEGVAPATPASGQVKIYAKADGLVYGKDDAGVETKLSNASSGGGDALTSNPLSQFAATTSAQLRGVISDETGTGAAVFANGPTLIAPVLGTPASGVATNLTGTASGLTAGNVTTNANLTGPITSVGNATTITNDAVTNAKLANMTGGTIKGRNVQSPSAGDPEDLTGSEATALLSVFVGDSGSGGTKGLVLAPSTGDASKYLKGNASWGDPIGTTTGTGNLVRASSPTIATPTITGDANYSEGQAVNFVIENRTSDPSTPAVGRIWLRTDL